MSKEETPKCGMCDYWEMKIEQAQNELKKHIEIGFTHKKRKPKK